MYPNLDLKGNMENDTFLAACAETGFKSQTGQLSFLAQILKESEVYIFYQDIFKCILRNCYFLYYVGYL